MFVLSVICISSTDTIGGRSIGFFVKKGRLIAVIIIKIKCKTEEIKIEKFQSLDEMTKSVNLNDFDSMNILIKGSRGIGLEKLISH